ncbi:hypothetical protein [Paraburkholderia pallida]|nr:hypothetical protein [Paraburkholderia pallida]
MSTPDSDDATPTFGRRMMWFAILWCVGFAGTMLIALPFHFLVAISMRQ